MLEKGIFLKPFKASKYPSGNQTHPGAGSNPESVLAAQPHAQNLVARDGDEWRDLTASFSEILVPIAEFLRRPTLR